MNKPIVYISNPTSLDNANISIRPSRPIDYNQSMLHISLQAAQLEKNHDKNKKSTPHVISTRLVNSGKETTTHPRQ